MGKLALRLSWALLSGVMVAGSPLLAGTATAPVGDVAPETAYQMLYPGIYTPLERPLVEAYLAGNAALKARGPVDVARLVAGTLPRDTPGIGPVIKVTEPWVRYYNHKYDPDSALRNDAAYARSLGYADILAYPTFGTNDDTFMVPYPPSIRHKLLVTQLNHQVTSLAPVYPGDTLRLVMDGRDMIDLTPPQGATYRSVALESRGSVYNQRGEKVNEVTFRVVENIRIRKDLGLVENAPFKQFWVFPNWDVRPPHRYTDADWTFIRSVWAKEHARGAQPLFWDDVKVGDTPAWTLDGPVLSSVLPVRPWGQGKGGSRTMKREIMDPAIRATLTRGASDGIYRSSNRDVMLPQPPPDIEHNETATDDFDTTQIHADGQGRSPLVNYMGRDFAIRHITNWMGDRGWLRSIAWGIMGPEAIATTGLHMPGNPNAVDFLAGVPAVGGRRVTTHPLTGDIYLIKSQVTRKYVENDRFLVELTWWSETITGQINEAGRATVQLPSRKVGKENDVVAAIASR